MDTNAPMRLALVTETFPPEVNGVAMTLGRLVRGAVARGVSVQVIRPERRDETLVEREEGFEEVVLPGFPLPGYSGLRMGQPCLFHLWRLWRRKRPDVAHIATEGPLGLAALAVASYLGLKVSSTYHTNFHQYSDHYQFGFLKKAALMYLRWLHNRCSCTLAPTSEMAGALAAVGFRRTDVLSRGVDTQLFDPACGSPELRRRWEATPEHRVFVFVGRVAREKNIRLAIEAYEGMGEVGRPTRMVVVGDGPERESLERDFPDVIFAGMQEGVSLAEHYASGDVFLFPSVTETFGNVVTEAMASGLLVVTYNYAAGREHIRPGANGLLARFDDAEDFRRQTRAAGCLEENEASSLRRQARQTALAISWDRIIDQFVEQLRRIAGADNWEGESTTKFGT